MTLSNSFIIVVLLLPLAQMKDNSQWLVVPSLEPHCHKMFIVIMQCMSLCLSFIHGTQALVNITSLLGVLLN